MNAQRRRVVLIGLDSAEATLIEPWISDGTLPNLRRLRERGAYGRLGSSAAQITGTPWPTFATSQSVTQHGYYHYLQWDPERMDYFRPGPGRLPLNPFWRRIGEHGVRTISLDTPFTYRAGGTSECVELCGWACHYKMERTFTNPPELLARIERDFGSDPLGPVIPGLKTARALVAERDHLIESVRRQELLALDLMQREPWDVFLIVFGATHRGGHSFWDLTGIRGESSPEQRNVISTALRDIYRAADQSLGKIVDAAGPDTCALVGALHGMGPNNSLSDLLPEMLRRVLTGEVKEDPSLRPDWLARARELVPIELRSEIKRRLPGRLQDSLSVFWRKDLKSDWSRTRAFCTMPDLHGTIRLNLRGRERLGIVEPGPEAEALVAEIRAGLESFVDVDNDQSVVRHTLATDELFPGEAIRHALPDLMVHWPDKPASQYRAIRSEQYGTIPWPTPGHPGEGYVGHHRPVGWLVAAGRPFAPGSTIEGAHILDLAPTVCALLGIEPPADMKGRPIITPAERSASDAQPLP